MNIKVIYSFHLPGQESPGIVKLHHEANGRGSLVDVDSELGG